ncbi:MAG: putative sugar O-acetyltransferase [Candidatus Moranbacteria bacterium GW2011_GWE1_49_15]|nr:MAG: putative sugar O-acetyltransferase [Candidatus Moranbacteria bacterium GW2011_GWE2_47_10]KKW06561.1 MAG: putative sugar O-acetyltransferase [Candidatus Moranbacteria bacterium GW2011_GWE1_49_15]
MLFNSLSFALFLPIVFLLYWFATKKSLKIQNMLLLGASYFFYASWDWRFLFLLMFSTLLDFFSGIMIQESATSAKRKFWLWLSVGINLGFLGLFKYYNFFISSFVDAFSLLGFNLDSWTLKVILPIGISFYTFHGLSYVFDIYNKKIKAERNFIEYAVFVSFFPLLVAGPIERATHLLPQIKKERIFDYSKAVDGLRQILWGLFKKIVIADQCAVYANMIFDDAGDYSGGILIMGAVFFAFQIYGDFSGYSDIALGTARLFGIDLLKNFAFPYFSRDIAEFWRRWHISLSSWFKDYLYIPLGGSRGGGWMRIRNTFAIFLVSGFWHGANWTFIIWGLLNALYIMPSVIFKKNRQNLDVVAKGKELPTLRELFAMLSTFALTTFAWIFFRSESVSSALSFIRDIFLGLLEKASYFEMVEFSIEEVGFLVPLLLAVFIVVEWMGREKNYAIENFLLKNARPFRWSFYYAVAMLVFIFATTEQPFIYFQF